MSERKTYIRFTTTETHPPFGHRTGVFKAAYNTFRDPLTPSSEFERIDKLLCWFDDNLPVPSRFARSNNPHAAEVALSWFKPTATDHIGKFRQLIVLIELRGYSVVALKTKRPGYVLYEDVFQLVAKPFADTPT